MSEGFKAREQTYFKQLKDLLTSPKHATKSPQAFYQVIVDAPFTDPLSATYLNLGIVVLLLVDEKGKVINRVALSNTVHAAGAVRTSEKHFNEIKIPLKENKNIISKAIKTGIATHTEDWKDLFTPALSPQSARFNQAGAGIACSIVEPFKFGNYGAALIFSFFKIPSNSARTLKFTRVYSDMVSEALANRGLIS